MNNLLSTCAQTLFLPAGKDNDVDLCSFRDVKLRRDRMSRRLRRDKR
ncbi:MAG: hypothetical protein R3D69_04035 [Xanthobacteraceae bacterium]